MTNSASPCTCSGTLHARTQTKSQAHFIDKLALMICLILLRLRRSLACSSPEEELHDWLAQACVDLLCLGELYRVLWQLVLNIVADDDGNIGCISSINCTDVTNSASPCLLCSTTCTHTNERNENLHRNLLFDLDPRSQAHFIDKLLINDDVPNTALPA